MPPILERLGLTAVASLAAEYDVACRVSLEKYMAYAGCSDRVNLPDGPAKQRVCVDGPVFDATVVDGKRHP